MSPRVITLPAVVAAAHLRHPLFSVDCGRLCRLVPDRQHSAVADLDANGVRDFLGASGAPINVLTEFARGSTVRVLMTRATRSASHPSPTRSRTVLRHRGRTNTECGHNHGTPLSKTAAFAAPTDQL
jgi:hypothetical protein